MANMFSLGKTMQVRWEAKARVRSAAWALWTSVFAPGSVLCLILIGATKHVSSEMLPSLP
jgi:hypothetical protein